MSLKEDKELKRLRMAPGMMEGESQGREGQGGCPGTPGRGYKGEICSDTVG